MTTIEGAVFMVGLMVVLLILVGGGLINMVNNYKARKRR